MPSKSTLTRWFFIFVSLGIISLILWNTFKFFNELKDGEREKMTLWASAQEQLFKDIDLAQDTDNGLLLEILQSNTTTPMFVVNELGKVSSINNMDTIIKNDTIKLQRLIQQYKTEYNPLELSYKDPKTKSDVMLGTLYYGNSPLLNKLKYYPATLILIIILFFLAIYLFYQTARASEQNKLWAGMAKETAHQIGTPLSSLVGWNEILKTENVNKEYIKEMEKDVERLETITERFSKIGSIPKLEKLDIVEETKTSYEYLKSRTSKLIDFELVVPRAPLYVNLNTQLYSWTIENLVKNGIDAMKGQGKITIEIIATAKKALIRISDTGKGIPKRDYNKIFKPGFTSKKRGWGLGLSLAKRIINGYHNGKIYVLKSAKDVGTTFEIAISLKR
ncbi:MAG: HAMP domain-containing histidine kinase [Flavobacteriaceae bacterium]|nr:HAMP domain-containing histidine kinase [Flavobacteriaceae bacterium]